VVGVACLLEPVDQHLEAGGEPLVAVVDPDVFAQGDQGGEAVGGQGAEELVQLGSDGVVTDALFVDRGGRAADREAGLAFFLLVDYTIGFTVSSPRTSVNEQRVRDTAIRTQLHEFFRSLPRDRFPALVALGEHVWVDNREERFTAGLDVLVDGLEQARRSPHRPALGGRPTTTARTTRRRQDGQQAVAG